MQRDSGGLWYDGGVQIACHLPGSYRVTSGSLSHADTLLGSVGVRIQKLTPGSPNLNAYIERWVQSIKHECLDHFIVLGERHLRYLVNDYVDYYHHQRPHQGLDNTPPHGLNQVDESDCPDDTSQIVCRTRPGGLLKHYEHCAA